MSDVQGHDERWLTKEGRSRDAWKTIERFGDQVERTGELQRWPETHTSVEGRHLRLGPYQIFIVSLFPDVAVLVPHDYGSLDRSLAEIVGWGDGGFHEKRLMNYVHYGTWVPRSKQVYWLSADLRVPLTPAAMSSGGDFMIRLRTVELVGNAEGDHFAITRLQ